jgi:hypothetical protein
MYTDPNGESLIGILVGAFIGGMLNMMTHADQIQHNWQAFAYFGIGAVSAGAGAAVGGAVAGFLGPSIGFGEGLASGFISGFMGGFAGGLVAGAGNAWTQGAGFGQGLGAGIGTGFKSGLISGVPAGIAGGIQGIRTKGVFDRGCAKLGVNPWDPVPEELRTDEFATHANEVWYKHGPDAIHKVDRDDFYTQGNFGRAIPANDGTGKFSSGKTTIYYHYEKAFRTPFQLFSTMGHELVHVSQFAALIGKPLNLLNKPSFIKMLDYYADIYVNSIGGIYKTPEYGDFLNKYAIFHEILNYKAFPWTKIKPNFIYPF